MFAGIKTASVFPSSASWRSTDKAGKATMPLTCKGWEALFYIAVLVTGNVR
jgi:hypothetical protein